MRAKKPSRPYWLLPFPKRGYSCNLFRVRYSPLSIKDIEVFNVFKLNLQQKISSRSFFVFLDNGSSASGGNPTTFDPLFILFRHFFNRIFPTFRMERSLLADPGDILFFRSAKEPPYVFSVTNVSQAHSFMNQNSSDHVITAAFQWALGHIFPSKSHAMTITPILAQIIFTEPLVKYFAEKIILVIINGSMTENISVSTTLQSFAKESKIMCNAGDKRYCNTLFAAIDYQVFGKYLDEAFGKTYTEDLPRTLVLKYLEDHTIFYDIEQLGGESFFNASPSLIGNIVEEIDSGLLEVSFIMATFHFLSIGCLIKVLQIQKYLIRVVQ